VDLTGKVLIFVNGGVTPPKEYARIPMSGTLTAHGYWVAKMDPVTVPAGVMTEKITISVQNGPSDGVALFDTSTQTLIDAFCYGGPVLGAVFNGIPGTWDLVEGTATTVKDSNKDVLSLIRQPNGQDTDNASADWMTTSTLTPGAPNP
jgi:hypothetical protein